MEEKIARLLEGNFEYENGSLDFSCTKLELSLQKNQVYEGSFQVYAPIGKITKGRIYSSDVRMRCLNDTFYGEEEEIRYCFDAAGMEEGDVLKGELYFISNQGEYYLPFVATVTYPVLESSMGGIKNLFHFTNLAKSNWAEALKLFYEPDFVSVFMGNDRQYELLYRGLSVYRGNEQNMEEFLQAINKKQRIEYLIDEKQFRIEDPLPDMQHAITVTRNGWGYTRLEVGTESGLVCPQKEYYSDDDFLGNHCEICFSINHELLRGGNNFDVITVRTVGNEYRIPVNVIVGNHSLHRGKRRARKHLIVQVMEYYAAFRLKKISTATWMRETQKLVEQMLSLDERDVPARLFQAQLLISQERYNEAQWILENTVRQADPDIQEEPVLWAYRMYLTTLINRDEAYTNEIAESVEELYKQNNDWRIAWLLLYLSEEYNKSGSRKWLFLEEQFQRGCISPMIYIEALLLMRHNPTLFMKLSDFELQVVHYAAKEEVLTKEIVEQLQCLVPREREYSDILYEVLKAAYQKRQDKETLTAICSILIKGGKTDSQYFKWYERAVEEGIRLTRLYDYYMLSMDLSRKTPINKMVLMYFSYHSDLDYERNSYLYADIFSRKDKFPELYLQYLPQIERFVQEQLQKGHMNKHLAYLYKHFVKEPMLDEVVAESLGRLLFMHQLNAERRDLHKVIVRHPQLKEEAVYPLLDGKAVIPLYGQDYVILFENNKHQRFAGSVQYTIEKLMIPGKIVKMIGALARDSIGLNLYLCDNGRENMQIEAEIVERFEALAASAELKEKYTQEIWVRLAGYYYDHDEMDKLDTFLTDAMPEYFSAQQRNELIRYMVIRGLYDKAYRWIEIYGSHGVDTKALVRLLTEKICAEDMAEDEVLMNLCAHSFRKGKYNETILNYLLQYCQGLVKDLRDLWRAAKDFQVDAHYLSERMIRQMLFTGSYVGEKMEIFKSYVKGGAKAEIEAAFLTQCAYDYFVRDKVMNSYVFEEIIREIQRGESLHKVCKLAALKYYAEHLDEVKKEQQPELEAYLSEMLLNRISLPYFTAFGDFAPNVGQLEDKTIIEYHAHPEAKVMIHYVTETEGQDVGEYRMEEMTEAFGGVCFKEFQLFFGESVQYYITEELNGESQLTESASIQKSDIVKGEDNSRYNLVNDIAIARTLQDYDTIDGLMKEYSRTACMVDKLFKIR